MSRDFPDDLPPLAFFAWRPNLGSQRQCQADDGRALNPPGDLICELPFLILWQIIFMFLPKEVALWKLFLMDISAHR